MKKYLISILLLGATITNSLAQCAMCRSTVVNNVSNGDQMGLAAGLNTGIMYLFVAPYLLVGIMALLWYRSAKRIKEKRVYPR